MNQLYLMGKVQIHVTTQICISYTPALTCKERIISQGTYLKEFLSFGRSDR